MNHPRRKVSPAFETPYARWAVAWLGGPVIGVVNGTARELLYGDRLGERTAHQVSAVALAGVLGGYVFVIERRWPIPTARGAAAIGAMWVGMTAAFEFGFGRFVGGASWSELLRDYDITRGRVWGLVLAWVGVAPSVARLRRVSAAV